MFEDAHHLSVYPTVQTALTSTYLMLLKARSSPTRQTYELYPFTCNSLKAPQLRCSGCMSHL